MKKTILTILMATAAFADQPILDLPPIPLEEVLSPKEGFFYVRFAAAERDLSHADSILPGLGVGYRRLTGDGAGDISIGGIGRHERKSGQIFWTAPKASYIHYLQPGEKASGYVGGGMAWGGVESKGNHFIGMIPSATLGYEFSRKSSILGFVDLTVSQPAVSVYRSGAFPGPIAELSTGIGF